MAERVMFSKTTQYLTGEGNVRKCKGLDLFLTIRDTLVIQPVSERMGEAKAFIEIPREDIDRIVSTLNQLKED